MTELEPVFETTYVSKYVTQNVQDPALSFL